MLYHFDDTSPNMRGKVGIPNEIVARATSKKSRNYHSSKKIVNRQYDQREDRNIVGSTDINCEDFDQDSDEDEDKLI